MLQFKLFFVIIFVVSASRGEDNEDKFQFNDGNCQSNSYFDENTFKCQLCDPNFNLTASYRGESLVNLRRSMIKNFFQDVRAIKTLPSCIMTTY